MPVGEGPKQSFSASDRWLPLVSCGQRCGDPSAGGVHETGLIPWAAATRIAGPFCFAFAPMGSGEPARRNTTDPRVADLVPRREAAGRAVFLPQYIKGPDGLRDKPCGSRRHARYATRVGGSARHRGACDPPPGSHRVPEGPAPATSCFFFFFFFPLDTRAAEIGDFSNLPIRLHVDGCRGVSDNEGR